MRCPFCKGTQGRCAATASGRWVTECCSCGRVVEERQVQEHQLFLLRAHDNPLCIVTPDLFIGTPAAEQDEEEKAEVPAVHGAEDGGGEDPFEPTGLISAFSTWSLEPAPVFARSSFSFSGHLAELERALFSTSSASSSAASSAADSSGLLVSVDHLRAYLQIIDVSSILDVDHDITDHAFQLFRDCSSTTCLRNRNIEALATAALVQAIREAQEPRTLQVLQALLILFCPTVSVSCLFQDYFRFYRKSFIDDRMTDEAGEISASFIQSKRVIVDQSHWFLAALNLFSSVCSILSGL